LKTKNSGTQSKKNYYNKVAIYSKMQHKYKNLIQNFFIGGLITASISYTGTFFSPVLAAIWWAFPVSLLPSMYYMHQQGKSFKFISKYAITTTYALIIMFITTMALGHFFRDAKTFWPPVGKSIIIWAVLSVIYFMVIKKFKLEKHF
jgi:hypothetical protein